MGIDYYACRNCGRTFPDCCDYVSCECGEHWCSYECAEEDGFMEKHCKLGKEQDDGYPEEECEFATDGRCDEYQHECPNWVDTSCNYCREEDFDDYELLEFALNTLSITRSELIESYKKSKSK